ncbi:hypothetical protein F4803DRAFT_150613 [Xylaria telfairii]|nr:hypothetical protein F4803DRAFT_150613 [Xylaria telfairii]
MIPSSSDPLLNPPSHNAVIVRPLKPTTPHEREKILQDVEYNVFAFPAGLLTCDFLSDSGTSAMTDLQWAACKNFQVNILSLLDFSSFSRFA